MSEKKMNSLSWKVSLIVFFLLLITALLVGAIGLYFYQRDEFAVNKRLAVMIATTVAVNIDGDEYERITLNYEETDYWTALKSTFDETKTRTDAMYLYALAIDEGNTVRYVVEGMTLADDPDLIGALGAEEEVDAFGETMLTTVTTGKAMASDVFGHEEYGSLLSGFAPIFNSSGRVVGVVGADISLDTVMSGIGSFAVQIFGVALIVSIMAGAFIIWYLNKRVGVPIRLLMHASQKIAIGETDITLDSKSNDEIGHLTVAFKEMVESTKNQVNILQRIANNDYTENIFLRSESDELNQAIQRILDNNIELISDIRESSVQVAGGASQMANSAQSLAKSATQQAAALQEFSASIADVYHQAEENAKEAQKAFEQVAKAGDLVTRSNMQMKEIHQAMFSIQESSEEIAQIIKVIDDIAFQTNILALNASVEAARAGQHGKGFAVVAEEVRNLAQKSADAARETADMIENSAQNVQLGSGIVRETEEGLLEAVEMASASAASMQMLNASSQKQGAVIQEINQAVEQVSSVVHSNTATAEESAANAVKMSTQANLLEQSVARFILPAVGSTVYPAGRLRSSGGVERTGLSEFRGPDSNFAFPPSP